MGVTGVRSRAGGPPLSNFGKLINETLCGSFSSVPSKWISITISSHLQRDESVNLLASTRVSDLERGRGDPRPDGEIDGNERLPSSSSMYVEKGVVAAHGLHF